jgi:molybdate transport system substrate-binding protein
MNTKIVATVVIIVLACASIAGYAVYSGALSGNSGEKPTLYVSIASSLNNVVANMTETFEQEHNCKLVINSAGSSTLYTQITEGYPCDVFMSADTKWTIKLNDDALTLDNTYSNFTSNSLSVIIAEGNTQNIQTLADLAKPGVRVVLGDPSIPVGSYANKTLWKIDQSWGNSNSPAYVSTGEYVNYNQTVHQNVVSYETSVANLVGKISLDLGACDVGIAFSSDATYGAMTGAKVQFLTIPEAVNTIGTYGIASIGTTTQPELAQAFVNFWLSTDGQALLNQFGFGI